MLSVYFCCKTQNNTQNSSLFSPDDFLDFLRSKTESIRKNTPLRMMAAAVFKCMQAL